MVRLFIPFLSVLDRLITEMITAETVKKTVFFSVPLSNK